MPPAEKNSVVIPAAGKLYRALIRAASSLVSPFLLFVRLYWGWQFLETGLGEIARSGQGDEFLYQSRHSGAGFKRGVRFGTRIRGRNFAGHRSGIAPDRVAAGDRHDRRVPHRRSRGALFDRLEPDKFYAAAPYTFLFASLIVLIFGPGKFSVDAILASREKIAMAAD
jgi:putative oxidoreductase